MRSKTLKRTLVAGIALAAFVGVPTVTRSEDIDIYTDSAANSGLPNVLFVIDNGANFEASGGSTACAAYNSGGAPSLGATNGGIQQCALVNAIEALPAGTVNIGILVGNANNFAKGYSGMSTTDAAWYNTCNQSTGYGGCVIRPLAEMNAANKTSLVNFIKSWKTSGSDSATAFNVKAGGNKTANMMQEAWAYFNGGGKVGLSGEIYNKSILGSGCQKNFIIFIANAAGPSSTPADTPAQADAAAALAAAQVGATDAQKTKISEIAKFATNTCGVPQLAAGNQASNWSSNWMDEWARLMFEQDGNSTGQGRQGITTYGIGLIGTSCTPDYPALLTTAAKYGGGRYFSASSAVDLTEAINSALNEIQAVNSVFSSASLPVSVNAQGTFLNQVFLGKFRPDAGADPRWVGNLKQYQFILVGADPLKAELQLGDANGQPAINSASTGFISPNAVSFWTTDSAAVRDPALSALAPDGFFAKDTTKPLNRNGFDSPDGELVERGGAAERLRIENLTANFTGAMSATNPRRLYTYCPAGSVCAPTTPSNVLSDAVNQFSTANSNLTALAFGDSSSIRITQIVRSGSTAEATTASAHGFASGSSVTISNSSEAAFNGTKTLISASGNISTFATDDFPTTPSQGAYTFSTVGGGAVSVISMVRGTSAVASGTETVTVTTTGHAFTSGSQVTIAGATTPSVYNGNWTIDLPNTAACPRSTCFTFSIPITPAVSASGFSAVVAPYSVAIGTITSVDNSGSGGTGNVATVTTSAPHGFHQGQIITIANSSNKRYDVTNVPVVSVLSSTSFTYQGYGNGPKNDSASGGSASPSTTPVSINVSRASNALTLSATATGATANAFGRQVNNTKVLSITKAGATASETAYTGANITVTCLDTGCTTFTYGISTAPAQPSGTITAAPPSSGSVTIPAAGITRSGSTATVTGATSGLFGSAAGQTTTVNVSVSGAAFPNESAYLGNGSLNITCQNVGCTTFTYPVVQTPAVTVTDPRMQAFQLGTGPARDPLITWIRGQDNFGDERGPSSSVTVRPSIHGDVIHSRPLVINYGDSRGIVVFYGANDGVFRAVNGNKSTGSIGGVAPGGEIWGLVLPEHFGQYNRLRSNTPELKLPTTRLASARRKDYFVDGSTGAYQKLKADGTIDQAIIYLTMRRGGRFMYAIDVTQPTLPTVLWTRSNATAGFEEMGQTWSRPRITRVKGYANPVLVFGAGYDPAEDDEPPFAGTMGRGMYVLDALTGALLWSARPSAGATACTGTSAQAACAVQGMNWSVPSDITFVDRDNDGFTDRFYFGDMGGNLWRVDLEPGTGTPSGTVDTWRVSKLAALGCDSGVCASGAAPRKFFFPPSVLFSNAYDLLMITSGDREHPLRIDATVTDRLFGIKDLQIGKDASASPGPSPTRTLSSLKSLNIVNSTTGAPVLDPVTKRPTYTTYDDTLFGYTVALETGEKGVNAPVTTRGTTFFGTNRPTPPAPNTCSANLGEARGYAVNPFTGAFDFTTFEGGGLPPTATTGIVAISWLNTATGQTTEVRRQFCVGCGAAVPPGSGSSSDPNRSGADRTSALGAGDISVSVPKNPRRTYWFTR